MRFVIVGQKTNTYHLDNSVLISKFFHVRNGEVKRHSLFDRLISNV